MYFRERIKKLRTERKYSQEQLAEILNTSRQTISSWENGKSYPEKRSRS